MLEFIKMFGLGILYTILFPVIVFIFALYLVYVFCNYLVIECLSLFGFFFGYTFSVETELEKKLRELKEASSVENKKAQEITYEYNPSTESDTNVDVMEGSDEQ